MRAWDVNGRMPEELQIPALPWHLEYLWGYFHELNRRRGSTGFGPAPITEEQLGRWMERKRIKLHDWEYRAILAIDDAYLEFQNEASAIRSRQGAT